MLLEDLTTMAAQGLTPQTATAAWVEAASIPKGDRSVYEFDCLGEILYAMVCIDQLNAANQEIGNFDIYNIYDTCVVTVALLLEDV